MTIKALQVMYCLHQDLITLARKTAPPQKAYEARVQIVRHPPVTMHTSTEMSQIQLPEVLTVQLRKVIRQKPGDVMIVWGMPEEAIGGEEFKVW